jgi:hypothetical protein
MAELDAHVAIRLEGDFAKRPKDERYANALVEARRLYKTVAAGEVIGHCSPEKVIAEFLLCQDEASRAAMKREALLDAQAAVRGAVGVAERAVREALQKATAYADRLVE